LTDTKFEYNVRPEYSVIKDLSNNLPYLVGAMEGRPLPEEHFLKLFKEEQAPESSFVFWKEAGRPLELEVAVKGGVYRTPAGEAFPEDWSSRVVPYWDFATGFGLPIYSDRQLVYRKITVPTGEPAGEYRITIDRKGRGFVLGTNAAKAVLEAPEGFFPEKAPWFFQAPEGGGTVSLMTSAPELLELKDHQGWDLKFQNKGDRVYEVKLPAGLCSVKATGPCLVKWAGVKPAFAFQHPEALKMPATLSVPSSSLSEVADMCDFPAGQSQGKGRFLDGNHVLRIALNGDGGVPLDGQQGTVEWWMTSLSDPLFLPKSPEMDLVHLSAQKGLFMARIENRGTSPRINTYVKGPNEMLRGFSNKLDLSRGLWTHMALTWRREGDEQQVRFYVNGAFSNPSMMSACWGNARKATHLERPQSLQIMASKSGGSRAAIPCIIDDLRISRICRYSVMPPLSFKPPRKTAVDKDTAALFRFEGDLKGQGPGGAEFEAVLEKLK
jgi:hypothetical protein